MIKIENTDVYGFEAAIRGMRNPKNSWDKSDSYYSILPPDGEQGVYIPPVFSMGPNDLKLAMALSSGTDDHSKYLRYITVTCDVTAPLYWWKEADTYKVGTVADSCSTMHKIAAKEFTLDDFSHEHLKSVPAHVTWDHQDYSNTALDCLLDTIDMLNTYRDKYLVTKDKEDWWQLIQLLPSSYNQRRTWMGNYQVLKRIYFARKDHKLDEWHDFCNWISALPYAKELFHISYEWGTPVSIHGDVSIPKFDTYEPKN